MSSAKMRQTLDRLRPWADERAVELALREWMQTSLTDRDPHTGQWMPLRLGDELERDAAVRIAAELHDIGQWASSESDWQCERCDGIRCSPPEHMLGAVGFMLRNVVAGREATDYGTTFEFFEGEPPDRTRRRYTAAYGYRGGLVWMRESLQYDLDLAALVRAGRTKVAARRWLQRNPGKHAKDAPPPRQSRAA